MLLARAQGADELAKHVEADDALSRLAALGLMTGGVTHDLRNVLCVVEASLRIVEGTGHQTDRQRASISGARDAIARGLALTRELLAFARDEPACANAGDVNEVITGAAHLLRCAANARLTIEIDLAEALPRCVFDEAQFKSALLNIVLNAREAMPQGGIARISTSLCHEAVAAETWRSFVRVRVEDNGPGVSDEVRARIFDPFFTTKGAGGVGLGLAQARSCLRMNGGDLQLASAPGKGAAFDLLLPLAPPSAGAL